jgi:NCS1 family nucleobase:cation symporter-1
VRRRRHRADGAVKQATGWLGPILMVLFLLNIISHNALNLYGAVLSIVTSIQTFASQWTPSIKVRVVLSSVLVGCCVVALNASADFIGSSSA